MNNKDTPSGKRSDIPYHLKYVDPNKMIWYPYSVEFESPDGVYGFHIYAISDDHAQLQLDALKETSKIIGKVEGVFDA